MLIDETASAGYPRWVRVCGSAAIAAALPTVVWRVVVGLGADLGTPRGWRQAQALPGTGTVYVLSLSVVQLGAALVTLVLVRPGGDRVPAWIHARGNRRLPVVLVVGCSGAGIAALLFLCVASAIHWDNVDPFSGAPPTAWAWLCWACYAVAPLWPLLLAATTIGYARTRRRQAQRSLQQGAGPSR